MADPSVDCCCGSRPCCGRTNLPATLYLTITALVNCTCNGWLGVTIELKKTNISQTSGLLRWAGCATGPCTTINGVSTVQTVYFKLECTVGPIQQVGNPDDLILAAGSTTDPLGIDRCVDAPYESNGVLIGGEFPSVDLSLSRCTPLLLVFRVATGDAAGSIFELLCQDPMAPPGPVEWEVTITE